MQFVRIWFAYAQRLIYYKMNSSRLLHGIIRSVHRTSLVITWISFLRTLANGFSVSSDNWQYMSLAQFELLIALCKLSRTTIRDALDIFLGTRLLVSQISREANFVSQCQVLTTAFYSSVLNAFSRSLDLSNVLKQGDLLASGVGSNYWYSGYYPGQGNYVYIYAQESTLTDVNNVACSCYLSSNCVRSVRATDPLNTVSVFVSGWRSGCFIYNALMMFTFECYFNATCLTTLRRVLGVPLTVQAMITTNSSRFLPKTRINAIVRQLFIEEWMANYNFTAYYLPCAPTTCSYVVDERRTFIVVLGTLVGIWSGLTRALDLLVPRAVRFTRGNGRQWARTELSCCPVSRWLSEMCRLATSIRHVCLRHLTTCKRRKFHHSAIQWLPDVIPIYKVLCKQTSVLLSIEWNLSCDFVDTRWRKNHLEVRLAPFFFTKIKSCTRFYRKATSVQRTVIKCDQKKCHNLLQPNGNVAMMTTAPYLILSVDSWAGLWMRIFEYGSSILIDSCADSVLEARLLFFSEQYTYRSWRYRLNGAYSRWWLPTKIARKDRCPRCLNDSRIGKIIDIDVVLVLGSPL